MGTLGRKAVWGAALALGVLLPAAAASASNRSAKIDNLLRQVPAGSSTRQVIIRTAPGAVDRVKQKLPHRGNGPTDHSIIPAITAELDDREIAALLSDPDVLSVSADARVHAMAATGKSAGTALPTTPPITNVITTSGTTGSSAVSVIKKALGLDDWFTGSNVTVAVIDSGLQPSVDFGIRIAGFYDFTGGRGAVASLPYDEFGHGTHIAGLIGSSGATSDGKYAGVAPGVKFLALKVLDKKGSGRTSNVISALEFAVQNKERFGIRIVNLSLGHPI